MALLHWSQGQLQPEEEKGPLCGLHHIRNRTRGVSLERVPSECPLLFNGHITGHYKKMREEAMARGNTISRREAERPIPFLVGLAHSHTHCGEAEPGPGHRSTASADLRKQEQKQLHLLSWLGEKWSNGDGNALCVCEEIQRFRQSLGWKGARKPSSSTSSTHQESLL